MFPAGAVGLALLILRISVAVLLVLLACGGTQVAFAWWQLAIYGVVAVSLCVGFCTPICSVLCGLFQLGELGAAGGDAALHLFVYALISFCLAIVGPGAFSIDARMFGRRHIDLNTLQPL